MSKVINSQMGVREWGLLLALSVLWGGSFFFVEVVVTELPPFSIVGSRVLLASIALWLYAFGTGLRLPRQPSIWIAFFIMGLINNVIPFSLLVWGQTYIASGLAAILNSTTPLFTVIVAGICLSDEPLTKHKLIGVGFGLCGVIVMIGPATITGLSDNLIAQLAVLGAAMSYAFATVYGRRFRHLDIDPVVTAAGQVSASTLILLPLIFYFEQPLQLALPGGAAIASLIALGLFSTALAYILYFRILASAGATNLALVTFLIPVSAILLGSVLLGESLQAQHFAGMVLIGGGLLALDGRVWQRIRSR